MMINRPLVFACMAAMCCVQFSGCSGGSGSVTTGTVQGKVTLEGAPVTSGVLFFIGESITDTASAEIQSDGTYTLRYAGGFSVPVADYRVSIGAANKDAPPPDPAALMATPEKFEVKLPPVPKKFLDPSTSGLIASVKEGQNTLDFDLKAK